MNNFIQLTNRDVVKVSPRMLNKDYKTNILKILKSRYEGICSKFGYIKQNSIRLLNVSKGTIEMSTFHGYVLFDVEFISSICNPAIGSVIKCKVKNINVFGILCTSGIIEDGVYQNILNIIIPKQDTNVIDNKQILDNVAINDDVNVEILGKKYILNNKNINIFGKIIEKNNDAKEPVMTETSIEHSMHSIDQEEEQEDIENEPELSEEDEDDSKSDAEDDKTETLSNESDDDYNADEDANSVVSDDQEGSYY